MTGKSAILLLAHGTPERLEEIPEYLKNVTGGRALPDSVVAEITHHYSSIGRSPLTDITREQARLLSAVLGMPVYFGMRNWRPYIAETLDDMRRAGIQRAIAICMAPQNSRTSVGLYRKALDTANRNDIAFEFVASWSNHPLLIEAFAEKLRAAVQRAKSELSVSATPTVIFTAHSVPCRTVQGAEPDSYAREARQTAMEIAGLCGLRRTTWVFAFQSQGASGGPWLGPTVEETLKALREEGVSAAVLQPVGFLCDHVEVLYDIDIAFRRYAQDLGMQMWRTESLSTSPLLISALEEIARIYLTGSRRAERASAAAHQAVEHVR